MLERINARFGTTKPARRACAVAAAACAAAALTLAGGSASAAPRAPTFAATLTHDSACVLTVTATWQNAQIDRVITHWYYDAEVLARFSPDVTGPFRRSVATISVGPADAAGETHAWRALVQFYDRRGAHIAELMTATDNALCKMNPLPPE